MKLLPAIICFGLFLLPICSVAQNDEDLRYRKYRVTLVPGLSTNGVNAPDYNAKYSLNIIAGYHGGLEGFEIGPVNINRRFSRGIQIGAVNATGGEMIGLHLSGLVNISQSDMSGLQFSGITNVSGGEIQGMQFAGVANIAGNNIQGMQFAGIANIAKKDLQGMLFSGITTVSSGYAQGLLFSGILNHSKNFQGIASAGIVNIAGQMEGIQIAGVANIADRGEGIQVGVFNYAKEFDGVPVGLISYYENGRKNIDIRTDENGFIHTGLKLGTRDIYNMISFGYNPFITNRDVWALGWTIGSYKTLDEAWNNPELRDYFLNADLMIQNVQDGRWSYSLNHLYSYRYLLGKDLNNGLAIYAGPTLNLFITREEGSSDYIPYSIFEGTRKGRDYHFWVGFTAGFQLFGQ